MNTDPPQKLLRSMALKRADNPDIDALCRQIERMLARIGEAPYTATKKSMDKVLKALEQGPLTRRDVMRVTHKSTPWAQVYITRLMRMGKIEEAGLVEEELKDRVYLRMSYQLVKEK